MLKRKKIIIIDGYNVLRNNPRYSDVVGDSPNFKDWTSDIWNAAREALLNDVCQLIDKNTHAYIIYDAARRKVTSNDFTSSNSLKNTVANLKTPSNVQVVFTNFGETADDRIQHLVFASRKKGLEVEVITSDLAIQDTTMNTGVTRTSARAFATNLSELNAETHPNVSITISTSEATAPSTDTPSSTPSGTNGHSFASTPSGTNGRSFASTSSSTSSPSVAKVEDCVDPETAKKLRALRDSLS